MLMLKLIPTSDTDTLVATAWGPMEATDTDFLMEATDALTEATDFLMVDTDAPTEDLVATDSATEVTPVDTLVATPALDTLDLVTLVDS